MPDRGPRMVRRGSPWRKVALTAFIAVIMLVGIALYAYLFVGDLGLSVNGYIALIAGALGTALLAAGLMSLLYLSNRRGYDEEAGHLPTKSRTRK